MSENPISPVRTRSSAPSGVKLAQVGPPKQAPASQPAPTASPVSPAERPPEIDQALAILSFKDGTTLIFSESQVKNFWNETPPRNAYLKLKIRMFEKLLHDHKDKLKSFEIKDPVLYALWNLSVIIANKNPDKENIKNLEKFILDLPGKIGDKPYLLLMFALSLLDQKLIGEEKARTIIENLIRSNPDEMIFKEAGCEYYAVIKRFDLAASCFAKIFAQKIGVPPKELKADNFGILSDIFRNSKSANDADFFRKMGNYLKQWAENETEPKTSEKLIAAARSCYMKAMSFDPSDKIKLECHMKLAEINFKLGQLSKNLEAAKGYFYLALNNYREALRIEPNDPDLLFKMGGIYLVEAGQRENEEGIKSSLKKAQACYERMASLIPAPNKELNIQLAIVYAKLESYEKAFSELQKAIAQDPEDPRLYALLGDLHYASGQIKVVNGAGERKGDYQKLTYALAAYKMAHDKARKVNDPALRALILSLVCQKFLALRIQAKIELTAKSYGNIFTSILKMALDLFSFNPLRMVVQAFNPPKAPKHTIEDLKRFLKESESQEAEEWQTIVNSQTDIHFYLSNMTDLLELLQDLEKRIEWAQKNKAKVVHPEIIKTHQEIRGELLAKIFLMNLKALFSLVNPDDQKWQRAIRQELPEVISRLLTDCLNNYMALSQFIRMEGIPIPKGLLYQFQANLKDLWPKLLKRIEEATEYAKEKKDHKFAFDLSGRLSLALGMLVKINEEEKNLFLFKESAEKCYEALISILYEKKDIDALINLGMNKIWERFSYLSLKKAFGLAKDMKSAKYLLKIGKEAYRISADVENESLIRSDEYRKLAVEAYGEALKTARKNKDQKNQFRAAVNLWKLGKYEESISAFEDLSGEVADKTKKRNYYIDLAYMHLALGQKKKALHYFKKLQALSPDAKKLAQEIEYIRENVLPRDVVITGTPYFKPQQVRAVTILYAHWFGGKEAEKEYVDEAEEKEEAEKEGAKDLMAIIEGGLKDFHQAQGYKVEVSPGFTLSNNREIPYFSFKPKTLLGIEIYGNPKTKAKAILEWLKFAGLAPGDNYDKRKIENAIEVARNKMQCFDLLNYQIEEIDGKIVLRLTVKEYPKVRITGGAEIGSFGAGFYVGGYAPNLFGGGEQLGGIARFNWISTVASFGSFYFMVEGKIYYKDPHIFNLAGKPVSFGASAETYGRQNYLEGKKERVTGGSITLGLNLSPRTRLEVTPGFHNVLHEQRSGPIGKTVSWKNSYFKQDFKFEIIHDHRNDWLFPSSGHYFSAFIQPGLYFGGVPSLGMISAGINLRKYFSLPKGFSFVLGGKVMGGYNLMGGDYFLLGNGFVRSNKDLSLIGLGALGITAEIRSPVWTLENPLLPLRAQLNAFGEAGCVLKSNKSAKCGFGVGGGVRIAIGPVLLEIWGGYPSPFGVRVVPPEDL